MPPRKAQCCGATLIVWLTGVVAVLAALLVILSACLIGYVEMHPVGSLGGRVLRSREAAGPAGPAGPERSSQARLSTTLPPGSKSPASRERSGHGHIHYPHDDDDDEDDDEDGNDNSNNDHKKQTNGPKETTKQKSKVEQASKLLRPKDSSTDVAGIDSEAALNRIADVWHDFLASLIQVQFMRERITGRRKAWEEAASQNLPATRLGMKAVVWPYAAYLHFGVKRVWSLGEYSQWADLCAALLSCGVSVKLLPAEKKNKLPSFSAFDEADIIFVDYDGIHFSHSKDVHLDPAKVWILDTFGTDGTVTDNKFFGRQLPLTNFPLNRFLSFVPGYAERNTYLGVATLKAPNTGNLSGKKWQCLLWSKVQPWLNESKGFPAWHHELLFEYSKHCEVIATIDAKDTAQSRDAIRACCPDVKIQGVAKPAEFLELMRSSAVYLGVGEPLIAPSAFEALNLGTHVIQPRFPEPKVLRNKPITQEWTSQHPFLEKIPEPYVFTVDPRDMSTVSEAFRKIRDEFDAYYEGEVAVERRAAHQLYRFYEFGEYPHDDQYSVPGFVGRVRGILERAGPLQAKDFDWERAHHPVNLPKEWQ